MNNGMIKRDHGMDRGERGSAHMSRIVVKETMLAKTNVQCSHTMSIHFPGNKTKRETVMLDG
jgi:hypothetical protein